MNGPVFDLAYEFPDRRYDLPWNRPDLFRLKLWYHDLQQACEGVKNFRVVLFGNFWSSCASQVRFAEIYLVPVNENRETLLNRTVLGDAYRVLHCGYEIALRKHRLVIDFGLTEWRRLEHIHSQILEIELGSADRIASGSSVPPVVSLPFDVKHFNEQWITVLSRTSGDRIAVDGQSRFVAQSRTEELPIKRRLDGKRRQVFFKPVSLDRLFGPISTATRYEATVHPANDG